MVGHKDKHQWEPTQGTIVDVRPGHHYLIDARNRSGALIQREVKHRSAQPYQVGSTVRIEISALNEIRFDPNSPGGDPVIATMTMADQIAEAAAAFDGPGARGPSFDRVSGTGRVTISTYSNTSGPAAGLGGMPDNMSGLSQGLAGLAGALGAMVGSSTTHIIGPDGQQLQVDPAEMQRLTQALTSGDTAERMNAIKQLHRIKAAAMTQAAKSGSLGAGLTAGAGQAGGAGTAGAGSAEDRLAKLEQLLSKGILTQSEYDAQRQRIIEGL